MKLAFSTLACADWDLEKVAETAAKFGYQGVELRVSGTQHVDPDFTAEERKKVVEIFERRNLEIVCLAAYTKFAFPEQEVRDKQIEELKRVIDLAHDLKCPYVRTFGVGGPRGDFTKEDAIGWIAEAFVAVDDHAAERGVRVLLETHDSTSTGEDVGKVLDKAGNVTAGALWDLKHPLMNRESVDETIKHLGEKIYHVHVKDWLEVPGMEREKLILLGAGDLPLREIVTKLKEAGYDGYYSLEWEKLWHPEIEDSYVAIYQFVQKMREAANA